MKIDHSCCYIGKSTSGNIIAEPDTSFQSRASNCNRHLHSGENMLTLINSRKWRIRSKDHASSPSVEKIKSNVTYWFKSVRSEYLEIATFIQKGFTRLVPLNHVFSIAMISSNYIDSTNLLYRIDDHLH